MTERMKNRLPVLILFIILSCTRHGSDSTVTTVSLLNEMTDLQRLTAVPADNYRTIQYSSYDRRSTSPNDSCWFANEDGFGNEPIPGFEKVLKGPDSSGTGEYLICDIKQPGAIVRLWTAGLNGQIRLFLDNGNNPVYEGSAQDFFWKTVEVLAGKDNKPLYAGIFRQFDATYFPIPFSERCRMEWIGDIRKIHFYHVGLRLFDTGVKVETFSPADFEKYSRKILEINTILQDQESAVNLKDPEIKITETSIAASEKKVIVNRKGAEAITSFSLKLKTGNIENALRESILNIYFDDSSIPQVQAPVGDFFGAAPGINPYNSLPFSVSTDSTLTCRFIMPYRRSVRIEIENFADERIKIWGSLKVVESKWEEGKTMQFRARWKIDQGLTTSSFDSSPNDIQDIIYLMASGTGRVVGAAAYIYNPSNATTSWGNWWGEGDEKIFVDNDTFPSFFGTGSEDYFNYSWSSSRIFSYAYCGQPRNDGPGNRGHVSNFRWHISDDILFRDKISFFMELSHHGVVKDFSYGRIVYFYALPCATDDFRKVSVRDISSPPYNKWEPLAYLGSAGYRFIEADEMICESSAVKCEPGKIFSGGKDLVWRPEESGEKISLKFNSGTKPGITVLGLTLSHNPGGGEISVAVNGIKVRFDGNSTINLSEPVQTLLANHFSDSVALKAGYNEITLESVSGLTGKDIGIDFLWIKEF